MMRSTARFARPRQTNVRSVYAFLCPKLYLPWQASTPFPAVGGGHPLGACCWRRRRYLESLLSLLHRSHLQKHWRVYEKVEDGSQRLVLGKGVSVISGWCFERAIVDIRDFCQLKHCPCGVKGDLLSYYCTPGIAYKNPIVIISFFQVLSQFGFSSQCSKKEFALETLIPYGTNQLSRWCNG